MQYMKITPLPADYAFPNTMKGQRGQIGAGGKIFETRETEIYSRLYKVYFNWNELERTAEDGEDFIRQVCDRRFGDCREHNIRIIPRVALQWPNHGDHTKATEITGQFPSDMVASTLDTPEFFSRVRNLVRKLGKVWNHDPRIAYIEMGIYGLWGEEHEDSLSRAAQKNMAEAFHEAFPDKLCMVRCPRDCMGEGFGMYWDSFAHIDEEIYARDCVRFQDWRKAVMGGEVAHNWGNHEIQPGHNMNDTLIAPEHRDRFMEYVFWQHNNHLGMWLEQDESYPEALKGLAEYQKRAGYRFVIESFAWDVSKPGVLTVDMGVKNIGASPFYYRWPLKAALLRKDRTVAREWTFEDTDLRTWMPGAEWSFEKHCYVQPAEVHYAHGEFSTEGLPDETYLLCISIDDPDCGKPSVLFATAQYMNGGRHPMGYTGIHEIPEDFRIPESFFDDQRTDHTITY